MRIVLGILIVTALIGCSGEEEDRKAIARVYDDYLWVDDFQSEIPIELDGEDSVEFAKNFISSWVDKRILLNQAKLNLLEGDRYIDRLVEEYKNDLTIYSFESEYLKQKLNTEVSEDEINEYYLLNKVNFTLNREIVKVLYVKLALLYPKNEEVIKLVSLRHKDRDLKKLESKHRVYMSNFYYDEMNWLYFDDLLKEIPLNIDNRARFLRENKIVKLQDEDFLYLLNITDYQTEGEAPLSLVEDRIKEIIVNKRKNELIKELRKGLTSKARESNNIEIYELK